MALAARSNPTPLLLVPVFWLGRFVRARLIGWGFLLLLATVAYFSARLALDTQVKTPRAAAAVGQKHAPDFTAKQFTVWRSSLDGATQYQLSADSMVHYRDDLSSVLIKPVLVAKTSANTSDKAPASPVGAAPASPAATAPPAPNQKQPQVHTTITAGQGLIRNDGELFQFTQAVKVVRKAPEQALSTLQSDSLVVLPDSDWVVTRSPVTLTQGKHQSLAKGGMEYSHTDADLLLQGSVRTTIAPQ